MTSATLISNGPRIGFGTASISAGVSDAAEHLAEQLRQVLLDTVRTVSGQSVFLPVHAALSESYQEAQVLAPHGHQALPTSSALREAHELLTALPHWCVPPEPGIEPSGAISFEWNLGPHRWLVFALKGIGTIEYSAMLGLGNEQWGTRNFAGTLGQHEFTLLSELMKMNGESFARAG